MEIMNPYFELFMLSKHNQKEFAILLSICFIQHFMMLFIMYLLSILIAPYFIIILAMYGEMFIAIYLTHKLHHAWRVRTIEDDYDVMDEEVMKEKKFS